MKRESPSKKHTRGKALTHAKCVITYKNMFESLHFLSRVKSKDDAVSQASDTPELIQDPNEIRHPSLTVAFTFKVSLCFPFEEFKAAVGNFNEIITFCHIY